MKIVLATETYLPTLSGVVVFVQLLAEALQDKGHTVVIFAPSTTGSYKEEVVNGVKVYRFASLPNPFRAKTRFVVQQYDHVDEVMEKFNPDVVHLHAPTGVPAMVQKAALKRFIPVIATHHFSFEFIQTYLRPLFFINKITERALLAYFNSFYQRCQVVTCPSKTIRRDLHRLGIKVPFQVVSNGVSLEKFAPVSTNKLKVDWTIKTILYVGRVDKDKNIALLIQMMRILWPDLNCQLLIIGTGNRVRSLKAQARLLGVHDRVIFYGKLGPGSDALKEAYQKSTVFAMPSNIETQGIVCLEALASGLPIVGPRAGAIPELVKHGVSGFLCQPSDAKEYAQYVKQILTDPELRSRFAQAGSEIVLEHEFKKTVERFIEIYQGL